MKFNKVAIKILKISITIGLFVFIFSRFNIQLSDIYTQIKRPSYIALAFFSLLLFPIISINRWQLFLKFGSGIQESFWSLWKIVYISEFLGMVFPSTQGRDIVRMALIEKKHKSSQVSTTSSSSVIIERLIGFLLLAAIGLISSLMLSYPQKTKIVLLIGAINVILWLISIFLINKKTYSFLEKIIQKIKYFKTITRFIEKTHYSLVVFPYKKILLPSILLILLFQFSSVLVLYFVFLSYDIQLPFAQHLVFYPLIAILSLIPLSISGLGVREGFFVYFYSLVGVPPEIAVSVSLMFYLLGTIISIGIGGVLYLLKELNLIKI